MSSPDASPGQRQAIAELYGAHHGWLLGWFRRHLGNASDAADLAQDTFVRLLAARELPPLSEPRAFLTVVARRLAVSHYRRREIEQAYLQAIAHQPPALAPSPETRLMVIEALVEVDRLLDGLPAKARAAFLWAQLDGLPYAEIAQRLGVSVSRVKQYMASAVRLCYFPESAPRARR